MQSISLSDPPPIVPIIVFDEPVFVVNEGNTVTINVVRGDDGGGATVDVGMSICN